MSQGPKPELGDDAIERIWEGGTTPSPVTDQEEAEIGHVVAQALVFMIKMAADTERAAKATGDEQMQLKRTTVAYGERFIRTVAGYMTTPQRAVDLVTHLAHTVARDFVRSKGYTSAADYCDYMDSPEGKAASRQKMRENGYLFDE